MSEVGFKRCYQCGQELPYSSFGKNKTRWNGCASQCKDCTYKRDRDYRDRNPEKVKRIYKRSNILNAESVRESRKIWAMNNKEKITAERIAREAILNNEIVRQPCEVCGEVKSEGHHWSYREDNQKDVIWLCKEHHGRISRKGIERVLNQKIEDKYLLGLKRGREAELNDLINYYKNNGWLVTELNDIKHGFIKITPSDDQKEFEQWKSGVNIQRAKSAGLLPSDGECDCECHNPEGEGENCTHCMPWLYSDGADTKETNVKK